MIDLNASRLTVGVVGAGTMGRGIAQVAASAGLDVRLHDDRGETVQEALRFIAGMLGRAVEKGRMTAEEAEAIKSRLHPAKVLSDLAGCHLVVEAIIEDMAAKMALFAELDRLLPAEAVLTTNTSSLSVTEIAAATARAPQVAGFHFFNPPPLMRLVEVVRGLNTAPALVEALVALAQRMGKEPVVCEDTPGFLVNHAGRAYGPEALRIVGEGICRPVDIDAIMKGQAGFRMGPFELLDLVGLDVAHGVMEAIYEQYYHEPAYKPSVLGRLRVKGGLLGRKSGQGFYSYTDGKPVAPEPPPVPPRRQVPVWISPAAPAGREALQAVLQDAGAELEDSTAPGPTALCVVTPVGADVTTAAIEQGLDPRRTVGVDTLFDLSKHRTLMVNPVTDPVVRDAIHGLLAHDGAGVSVICDSPGFVAQRMIAMVVNVACNIAQQRIAAPDAIDTAVQLGLNYPRGPLEWGDAIGPARILQVLRSLHDVYQDPRYRPSPWLVRRAALGVSLKTPER